MANVATVKALSSGTNQTGVLFTDRRDYYISPTEFSELFKNETPYLSLSLKNREAGLKDPVFKMFQYENTFMRKYLVNNSSSVTIAAASAGAAAESSAVTFDGITGYGDSTEITSAHVGKIFEVWDSTKTTLRGRVICTDDASSSTALFKNLGTTAISTVDNDLFIQISNAQPDGSTSPDASSSELAVVWGQCQQFKTPIELKGDILYSALRGESNELSRLRAEKMKEHKCDIEGAFGKGENPAGLNLGAGDTFAYHDALVGGTHVSGVIRTTYGIIPAITKYGSSSGDYQNIWTITEGSFLYEDYVDMAEKLFQYYPPNGQLYAVCGAGGVSYFSKLLYARSSKDNWTVMFSPSKVDSFGFNIRALDTPHGTLNLIRSDSHKFEYNKTITVVDDRYLRFMEFRPTKFEANIKTDNGYDGEKDQYFSQCGLGLTHIKTHAKITIQ